MNQVSPPISGKTRFYGMFGDPVEHLRAPTSLNQLMNNRGVDAVFLPLHVAPEHLAEAIAGIRRVRNFVGFMVSIPHKAAAAELCDEILPNGRACGVVNAVRIDHDGRLVGESFDGLGMVKSIQMQRDLNSDTRVLMVGAGGVGRSIAVALALAGVGYLAISNRTPSKADELADTVRRAAPDCVVKSDSSFDPEGFDIVVNATSLGLNGQGPMPVEVSRISKPALVAEVVMVPEITPMLHSAQEQGLDVVPGSEMLTQQIQILADFFGMAN
jgi:shikimate dehydrogenase